MSKQQFNLIVFDWDGTLMDSTSAIVKSLQDSAADLGLPTPDKKKAAHVIGLGLREALETVLPDVSPEYYPKLIERYRTHFLKNSVSLSLFDGVREMLDDLKNQDYFSGSGHRKKPGRSEPAPSTRWACRDISMPAARLMKRIPNLIRPCCWN